MAGVWSMRWFPVLLLPLAATWTLACVVTADVGDLGATPSDAGPGSSDGATPIGSDAGPPPDAATDATTPPVDAGCGVAFAQEASFVDVQVVQGPTPFFNGGTIVPGTYALTSFRDYYPNRQGTLQVRETMVVRGSSTVGVLERLTEARSASGSFEAYPLHGETTTYDASGNTPGILTTPECPTKGFQGTGTFQSGVDTLSLWDDSAQIERVYRRLR